MSLKRNEIYHLGIDEIFELSNPENRIEYSGIDAGMVIISLHRGENKARMMISTDSFDKETREQRYIFDDLFELVDISPVRLSLKYLQTKTPPNWRWGPGSFSRKKNK